ncbi:MAG: hypothetical protein HN738_08500 [Gammaproteobacteria bacterium]|jgi:hypothetical protein|nr:hypothetical protein [Gammaproteobacteria bacterium]|tara:strand:+ start:5255 stop:5521 length:267 start_codon:yes stop_codon:yes gene_type:complete
MMTIEFKTDDQDYKKTIIAFLTIPLEPSQGATYDEVMAVAPLLEKVQAAEGSIELTEEEHMIISERFRNGRYQEISTGLYQMLNDIVG